MNSGNPHFLPTRSRQLLAALVLLLLLLTVFWRVLGYPFIQDDWGMLYHLRFYGFKDTFRFASEFFFRPLGVLYLSALFKVFGIWPLPFHLAGLLIFFVNCLLVMKIGTRLSGDHLVGWAAAALWGTATPVNLEPLLWAVGIYDLSATFFVLVSLLLLMDERFVWSALTMLCAMCSKEAALFLPILAVAYEFAMRGEHVAKVGQILSRLWLHLLLGVGYIAFLLARGKHLSGSHPYYLSFHPEVLTRGGLIYALWAIESFVPVKLDEINEHLKSTASGVLTHRHLFLITSTAALLCAIAVICSIRLIPVAKHSLTNRRIRVLSFLVIWIFLALMPVIGLKNHRYQYYLTYSLVPCAILVVLAATKALAALGATTRIICLSLAVWVTLLTYSSASFFAQKEHEGPNASIDSGMNGLISRARTVDIVRRDLANFKAQIGPRTALVLEGVDIWAFDKDAGPRIWFNDPTVMVVGPGYISRCGAGTLVVARQPQSQLELHTGGTGTLLISLKEVLWFRLSGRGLLQVPSCGR